jgi:hypothetical protein
LTAALASQGQTPQGAIDAARNLGSGATLADVGPATQNLTSRLAAQEPGSAYGPILNSGATVDVTPVRDMIAQARVDPILAGVKEDPISSALAKAQSLILGSNPAALPINVAHQGARRYWRHGRQRGALGE